MRSLFPLLLVLTACNEPIIEPSEEAILSRSMCIVLQVESGERYEITNLSDFVDLSTLDLPQAVRVKYKETAPNPSICQMFEFIELKKLELED